MAKGPSLQRIDNVAFYEVMFYDLVDCTNNPVLFVGVLVLGLTAGVTLARWHSDSAKTHKRPEELHEHASEEYKRIYNLKDDIRVSMVSKKWLRLAFRATLVLLMIFVFLRYKYSIIPLYAFCTVIVISIIVRFAGSVEDAAMKKLTSKLDKLEYQVFQKKKEVIKNMDPIFKQEVMDIMLKDIEVEQYDPNKT